jgi:hypothetical protein
MNDNPWNTPEAIAYFESEWEHAVKGAKAKLAKACEKGGVFEKLGDLPYALYGELNNELGDANYRVLMDLIFAAPLLAREFLKEGETGKL